MFVNQTDNGTLYTGYAIDVWDIVAKRLGIEYIIHEVADDQFGVVKNNVWTGLIGDIIYEASVFSFLFY